MIRLALFRHCRSLARLLVSDFRFFLRQHLPTVMLRANQKRPPRMPLHIDKSQAALLLFLLDSEQRVDPLRLTKGIFIFTMEAPETWLSKQERYKFIPYNYGPYSQRLRNDLDQLVEQGYVLISKVRDKNWDYYYLSEKGKKRAHDVATSLPNEAATYLRKVRKFVLNVSVRKLLDTVYDRYPAYAVKSIFKR